MILLIDNFDSFTYNIAQSFERLGKKVQIVRPGSLDPFDKAIDSLVIGPGPGHPSDATYSLHVISQFLGQLPILGICLGHQCLAHHFGAEIVRAERPMHGKPSQITHDGCGLFANIPSPHSVIRYHSLTVNPLSLPTSLLITAQTAQGEIMGLRHTEGLFESVQYHPDSVMTEYGLNFFENFLRRNNE